MLTPREKSPLPEALRRTKRCVTQDNEPNTLPTELFGPQSDDWINGQVGFPAVLGLTKEPGGHKQLLQTYGYV